VFVAPTVHVDVPSGSVTAAPAPGAATLTSEVSAVAENKRSVEEAPVAAEGVYTVAAYAVTAEENDGVKISGNPLTLSDARSGSATTVIHPVCDMDGGRAPMAMRHRYPPASVECTGVTVWLKGAPGPAMRLLPRNHVQVGVAPPVAETVAGSATTWTVNVAVGPAVTDAFVGWVAKYASEFALTSVTVMLLVVAVPATLTAVSV
jgi:hypothetical protein